MMTILCLRCEERKPGAGGKVVTRWSSLRRLPGLLGCDVSGYDGEIPVSLFTGINVDAATRPGRERSDTSASNRDISFTSESGRPPFRLLAKLMYHFHR
jgi:hypothetical protein